MTVEPKRFLATSVSMRVQFHIKGLLLLTAIVAIFIAFLREWTLPWMPGLALIAHFEFLFGPIIVLFCTFVVGREQGNANDPKVSKMVAFALYAWLISVVLVSLFWLSICLFGYVY